MSSLLLLIYSRACLCQSSPVQVLPVMQFQTLVPSSCFPQRECLVTCESATMWKSLSHRTRGLSLFSPYFSSSSTTPSSSLVRRCHFWETISLSAKKKLSRSLYCVERYEAGRDVKVIVWWDFDSCRFPFGYNPNNFAPAVTTALEVNGINGPVQIKTFGNLRSLERFDENNIPYSEVPYDDVPVDQVKRDRARKVMFWEILKWVECNPPPAHLFFICAGNYFAPLLNELRMRNYNILLASDYATPLLRRAATIMWRWNSLSCMILYWGKMSTGENSIGKVLYNPPSGADFDSWKLSVLVNIGQMMQSHTEAISVDHLFSELGKDNWKFKKIYYDRDIFTEFLIFFKTPLQIKFTDDGVRSIFDYGGPIEI